MNHYSMYGDSGLKPERSICCCSRSFEKAAALLSGDLQSSGDPGSKLEFQG
ncbi:MAG: hypothetical protein K1X85_02350 [Ignavibacteria bacterium]|nr:hypothetical protein [Ignavibacteria bacterium]